MSSLWKLRPAAIRSLRISYQPTDVVRTCSNSGSGTSRPVLCVDDDGVRRITLNNPKQRNVLSFEVLTHLRDHLTDVDSRRHIGCVVVNAVGTVFSAGHDLRELTTSHSRGRQRELFDLCADVMMRIAQLSVPVVAQVGGHAAAAGCQLVASCDIVVASDSAKFSTPGINVGLFCSTPAVAVVRALPVKVAALMLHTGMPITAKEAAIHGLVSRLVDDQDLEDETTKIARAICEKSLSAQTLGKRCWRRQLGMSVEAAYGQASEAMVENLALKDAQSGIEAFIAKRPMPKWSNR